MFKLNFEVEASHTKINLKDEVYLAGSCFSDEIGKYFHDFKFSSTSNPFGTIYNPISIFKTLRGELDSSNIIESQDIYYHWDCHGKISGLTFNEASENFNSALEVSSKSLVKANHLILTLGTSFVYREKSSNEIVANCHKVPSKDFLKELLTKDEIINDFAATYETLGKNLNIIFTVSPVRHVRDGLIENNLSKAILIEAVHEIVKKYKNIQYFPSYEIMIDELRDYRFYTSDMLHPSNQAIEYIWNKFQEAYFDNETKQFVGTWSSIIQAMNHKSFQPTSRQHQNFLKQTLDKLYQLRDKVDISTEEKLLLNQMK